ncbi:MAG: MoaD/ThiS family protein, partial [Desulfobulbus sp.]
SGADLRTLLQARGGEWADALSDGNVFRLVINKKISQWHNTVPDGAEVGFLPPVTGG